MAYQNVGTPRFYVNTLEWLMENDMDFSILHLNSETVAPNNHAVYRTIPDKQYSIEGVIYPSDFT